MHPIILSFPGMSLSQIMDSTDELWKQTGRSLRAGRG